MQLLQTHFPFHVLPRVRGHVQCLFLFVRLGAPRIPTAQLCWPFASHELLLRKVLQNIDQVSFALSQLSPQLDGSFEASPRILASSQIVVVVGLWC